MSDQEVKIDESYVQTEREWPIHRHKSDDGAFLGTSGNYRKLVKSLVPLTSVSLTHAHFRSDDSCQHVFETLQQCLKSVSILAYSDYTLLFVLDTNASNMGCGAVLSKPKTKENASWLITLSTGS